MLKKVFRHKVNQISYMNFQLHKKESYEAHYWLQLLSDSKYLTQNQSQPLIEECIEIQKIITAILKTSKQ